MGQNRDRLTPQAACAALLRARALRDAFLEEGLLLIGGGPLGASK